MYENEPDAGPTEEELEKAHSGTIMHDGHECQRCGDEYSLRDGDDPTPYCDRCAHVVIEEQDAEIARLRDELRGITQIANSRICEACLEHHDVEVMCPSHECRTTGQEWFRQQMRARDVEITRLRAALDRTCAWRYDETHGKYDTSCGHAWTFTDGDRAENGLVCCPFCGGRVVEPGSS